MEGFWRGPHTWSAILCKYTSWTIPLHFSKDLDQYLCTVICSLLRRQLIDWVYLCSALYSISLYRNKKLGILNNTEMLQSHKRSRVSWSKGQGIFFLLKILKHDQVMFHSLCKTIEVLVSERISFLWSGDFLIQLCGAQTDFYLCQQKSSHWV